MERIEVASLDNLAARLSKHAQINNLIPDKFELFKILENTLDKNDYSNIGSSRFIINEWMEVLMHGRLLTGKAIETSSLGRKIRLTETKRKQLWENIC